MITPIQLIHIASQVKTRQSHSYKFKKFAKISNFEKTLHAIHLLKLLDNMTPTHQALLPGRYSRITGQVVQQAVEVVRLGPLNRTARCPCKQGFLTLSKMHVKTPLKF